MNFNAGPTRYGFERMEVIRRERSNVLVGRRECGGSVRLLAGSVCALHPCLMGESDIGVDVEACLH